MKRVANTLLRRHMVARCPPTINTLGIRSISKEINDPKITRPDRNVRLGPLKGPFNSREMAEIYAREFKESSSSEEIVAIERSMSREIQTMRKTDKSGNIAEGVDDPESIFNVVYPVDLANVAKRKMGREPDDDGRMTKDRRV